MRISWYLVTSGKLEEQPAPSGWPEGDLEQLGKLGLSWFDIAEAKPDELQEFLKPLNLHPLQLAHCLDSVSDPGVQSFGKSVLLEYPAAFDRESAHQPYLSLLLQTPVLVTIRKGTINALDDLVQSLTVEQAPPVLHLPQLIYLILDEFADLNVEAQIAIRDQIVHLEKTIAEKPATVSSTDLSRLRWQVQNLVSLVEDQLYCISGLNAADNEALQDPHRKAYVQDLVSEIELAQRGVYRLETRMNALYNDYQVAGNNRMEWRLRVLTIVSAITLPLGLVAGLLGMNVGGVPGTESPLGFIIVVILMVLIVLAEYWYFKRQGWFD